MGNERESATLPKPWRVEGLSSRGMLYTLLSEFGLTPSIFAAPPEDMQVNLLIL